MRPTLQLKIPQPMRSSLTKYPARSHFAVVYVLISKATFEFWFFESFDIEVNTYYVDDCVSNNSKYP